MKKKDILILLSVILIAGTAFLVRSCMNIKTATTVIIKQDDKKIYSGSLFENMTVSLDSNTIVIKDGTVDMTEADCKNQICVNHKIISKKGESIICLPNKVIVEIN